MSTEVSQSDRPAAPQVVLGSGPDALRAAASLAWKGEAVLLLQQGPGDAGMRHPELPMDTGRLEASAESRAAVEGVLGPLVEAPEETVGVARGGQVHTLPLGRLEAGRLLPPQAAAVVGRAWARTRVRNGLAQLIGGGQEERSYRDWVVRRMGEPAWFHLYRSYAERRWGAPCDQLEVSVARLAHGLPSASAQQVVGGGTAKALEHAASLVRSKGGEIRTDVAVESLRVEEGRVVAVVLASGEEVVLSGPLWCTNSPSQVATWLGEACTGSLDVDSRHLELLTRVQVTLRGSVDGLPHTVHVLDEESPFYRVVTPYGLESAAIFHLNYASPEVVPAEGSLVQAVATAAAALGLGDFSTDGARVEVVPEWEPVRVEGTQARLRRVRMTWQEMGLRAVGRGGIFLPVDASREVALVLAMAAEEEPDQREIHRALTGPPVALDDLDAHITRFIYR